MNFGGRNLANKIAAKLTGLVGDLPSAFSDGAEAYMAAMNSAMEAGGAVMVESVNMNLPFGCGMPMSGYWWRWWWVVHAAAPGGAD